MFKSNGAYSQILVDKLLAIKPSDDNTIMANTNYTKQDCSLQKKKILALWFTTFIRQDLFI